MPVQVALKWPANRRRTLYQNDALSLLEEFAREEENLFTQDPELDVTIIEIKNGVICRNLNCTDSDQIVQYIQVLCSVT